MPVERLTKCRALRRFKGPRRFSTCPPRLLGLQGSLREQFARSAFAAAERTVAVIARMDVLLDVHRTLRISEGEAHIFRNLGGVVTGNRIRPPTVRSGN